MTAPLGPDLELQIAIVAVLNASADLKALIGNPPRINPPEFKTWPGSYIEIGEGQTVPDLAECIDGSEVFPVIHIWSRKDRSFADAKQIAATIWAALNGATLTPGENRYLILERDTLGDQNLRDPDGVTLHIASHFRAVSEPV